MEIKSIPKWLLSRYSQLYQTFKLESFTIVDCINEPNKISPDVISRLIRAGWLKSDFDKNDRRLRDYKLIDPDNIISNMKLEKVSVNDDSD